MRILGKFYADVRVQKRHVTSRPMVRFSQNWYQKMRKTWKKKVIKRRVAICGGREAVADFVQGGGGQIDPPPPPVKIGLTHFNWAFYRRASEASGTVFIHVCLCVCLFVSALTFEWFHFSSPNFQRIFI